MALKNGLTILMLTGLAVTGLALSAHAAPKYSAGAAPSATKTADQTCDPKYWKSMSAKAWMEAEREIVQNKNLIFKPDSVMEYVCFDNFMQHAAKHVGDIFTHTTYFNGQMIIPRGGSYALETALTKVVTDSLKTYIQSNFNHTYLGERSSHLNMLKDRTLGDATSMQAYSCTVMASVWNGAKCENFIDNDDFKRDGFFPFKTLKSGGSVAIEGYEDMEDPRKFPTACAKPNNPKANWTGSIMDATNDQDIAYDFKKPNEKTYDEIRPKLEPGKCTGADNKGILTGVTVISTADSSGGYADGVCSNPGCSFKQDGTCAP